MPALFQNAANKLTLFLLMFLWLLFQGVGTLFLAARGQLTLLRLIAALVRNNVGESGLTLLPPELLYHIIGEIWRVCPEKTQISGSYRSLLALSQ
jgi:hypothetical protein